MINAVSFGAQSNQERKSPSVILPGIVGAGIGAGVAKFTPAGQAPKFESAGDFFQASESDKILSEIKDESKKADVEKLIAGKKNQATAEASNQKLLEGIFEKDATDADLSKVLAKAEGAPTLESLQKVLSEKHDEAITEEESEIAEIEKTVKEIKDGESGSKIMGGGDKAIQVTKDEKGVITFFHGKTETKDGKTSFTPTDFKDKVKRAIGISGKKLEEQKKEIADDRAAFIKKKALIDTLGITHETKTDLKVTKEQALKALNGVSTEIEKDAAAAFEALKPSLGTEFSMGKMGVFAAGGALIAGALGYALTGDKN